MSQLAVPNDVTVILINFKTLNLTKKCLLTLRKFYPTAKVIVVDNGSHDESSSFLEKFRRGDNFTRLIVNEVNRFHGPALHQAINLVETAFAFTLDSDCEILKGGFLEEMRSYFTDRKVYAVGELRYKTWFGYTFNYGQQQSVGRRRRVPYVHPFAMLLRVCMYHELMPFEHHGAPCLNNMKSAQRRGYRFLDFPVDDFVLHLYGGTSRTTGYGLVKQVQHSIEWQLERISGWLFHDPSVKNQLPPLPLSKDGDPKPN